MNQNYHWTELYDPKEPNGKRTQIMYSYCNECKKQGGHAIDCSQVTLESLAALLKIAQVQENYAKQRAERYWKIVLQYQGKLAVLRNENNKLRKANEKLRNAEKGTMPEKE